MGDCFMEVGLACKCWSARKEGAVNQQAWPRGAGFT